MVTYNVGDKLAAGGQPLREEDVALLRLEYQAQLKNLSVSTMLAHSIADFGMFVALYVLCGTYIYYHERRILTDLRRYITMLGLVVVSLGLCIIAAREAWRAEIIPISLFAMTLCIAYHRELALIASSALALVLVMSLGQRLPELIILVAAAAGPVLFLSRIRNRTKLIYVGLWSALVTMLTSLGVGTLTGQSFGSPDSTLPWMSQFGSSSGSNFFVLLISGSTWFGFCSLLSGLLMTGLLPFIEKLF